MHCAGSSGSGRAASPRTHPASPIQARHRRQNWSPPLIVLVASADRAELNDALGVLREAGEDVPARLSRRGSLASVSLADLVADITRVRAWFDPEPSDPDESHDAAAGGWAVGDRVTARATAITVRAGRRGTVMGFSGAGIRSWTTSAWAVS